MQTSLFKKVSENKNFRKYQDQGTDTDKTIKSFPPSRLTIED